MNRMEYSLGPNLRDGKANFELDNMTVEQFAKIVKFISSVVEETLTDDQIMKQKVIAEMSKERNFGFISAIKCHRFLSGSGLRESKTWVDQNFKEEISKWREQYDQKY